MARKKKAKPTQAITNLVTERLVLVRYIAGMVTDEHVAWLNDPANVRYSEQRHAFHSLESQHEYLNKFPAGSYVWLICKWQNGLLKGLGTITAYVDANNKRAEMGILIPREHQSLGIGYEAWKAVMEFLTGAGITKIDCATMLTNTAMVRLAMKAGMDPECVHLGHFLVDGKPVAMLKFGTPRR